MGVSEDVVLYYHKLFLAVMHKLPTLDFCCCLTQVDRVLKLFNTFTSEDQLLTNISAYEKSAWKNLFTMHDLYKTNAVKCK